MQGDIEEDLDVVQQDDVTPGLSDDLIEKRCDSNGPLPLARSRRRRESSTPTLMSGAPVVSVKSLKAVVLPAPSAPTTRTSRW